MTSGESSIRFRLHFRSVFLQPDLKFPSCLTNVGLLTDGTWNLILTFCCLFFVLVIFGVYQDILESKFCVRGSVVKLMNSPNQFLLRMITLPHQQQDTDATQNNTIQYNTKFVKRHVAVASDNININMQISGTC